MSPRHHRNPIGDKSGWCATASVTLSILRLALMVMSVMRPRVGKHSQPPSCSDRYWNDGGSLDIRGCGRFGRGLRMDGGAPREVPGCGGSD